MYGLIQGGAREALGADLDPALDAGLDAAAVGARGVPREAPAGATPRPYADAWQHIGDELRRVALLLGGAIRHSAPRPSEGPLDAFRGVVISDDEVGALVDTLARAPTGSSAAGPQALSASSTELGELEAHIRSRCDATARAGVELPLARLQRLFGLGPFEQQCLLLCLAPELDRRYERLFGYLQDDATCRRPSVGLILDLLCATPEAARDARAAFDPQAPLACYRLCRLQESATPDARSSSGEPPTPLLSRTLCIDERMVDFLIGRARHDARLDGLLLAPEGDAMAGLDAATEERIVAMLRARPEHSHSPAPVFHLWGPRGAARRELALAACRRVGAAALVADLQRALAAPVPLAEVLALLVREAALEAAVLCLENLDALAADHDGQALALVAALRLARGPTFLIGVREWRPPPAFAAFEVFAVPVEPPGLSGSSQVWREQGRHAGPLADDIDLGSLASRFRFGPIQIRDAFRLAGRLARWRTLEPAAAITMADLDEACRRLGAARISGLARRLPRQERLSDLVLPPHTRGLIDDLCNEARHQQRVLGDWGFAQKLSLGRGLTALFSGPPGTGKTLAVQTIAGALGLDLYRVDLSQVVSKYIGETEKHLGQVFDDAEATRAILFFDEADALFGKRSEVKDSHDRYANVEVGFLLQRMEEFEGVAILATNLRKNLDEAFVRRLRFVIEFPFPDEEQRRRIWEVTFPTDAPLAPDVDFGLLAREVRLAGGHIRNIGLAAAFYAAARRDAIGMADLLRAAAREYEKLGKSWTPPERDVAGARKEPR